MYLHKLLSVSLHICRMLYRAMNLDLRESETVPASVGDIEVLSAFERTLGSC